MWLCYNKILYTKTGGEPAGCCLPIHLCPCQRLASVFLILAILVSVKWYLIVVLICMSLMVNDTFMKCLFQSFANYLKEVQATLPETETETVGGIKT